MDATTSPVPPEPAVALCVHCGIRPDNRRRRLCSHCYYQTPEVRKLYGPRSPRGNRGVPDDRPRKGERVGMLGALNKRRRKKPPPTSIPPGEDKVAVFELRAELGLSLFNARDAKYPGDSPWVEKRPYDPSEPTGEAKWVLDRWGKKAPPSPYVGPVGPAGFGPDGQGRLFLPGITLIPGRRALWGRPGLRERLERAERRREAKRAMAALERILWEMADPEGAG